MEPTVIGLIAAMPDEIRPLLRQAGGYEQDTLDAFSCYRFRRGSREIVLVRSGMGTQAATAATELLVRRFRPGLIVNFGFCGTVRPGPVAGDIIVGERIFRAVPEGLVEVAFLPAKEMASVFSVGAIGGNGRFRLFPGSFVTTAGIEPKGAMAKLLPADLACPALEMETAAVAGVAAAAGVPFLALRGVSDNAEEELGFTIADIADAKLRLSPLKIALLIARRPTVVPQFLRLSRNSRLAAENLAVVLLTLIGP